MSNWNASLSALERLRLEESEDEFPTAEELERMRRPAPCRTLKGGDFTPEELERMRQEYTPGRHLKGKKPTFNTLWPKARKAREKRAAARKAQEGGK